MNGERHSLIAYLATLGSIVALVVGAVAIVMGFGADTDVKLSKMLAALGFISGGVSGLIGVIGTFKPQQRRMEIDQPPEKPIPVEETRA